MFLVMSGSITIVSLNGRWTKKSGCAAAGFCNQDLEYGVSKSPCRSARCRSFLQSFEPDGADHDLFAESRSSACRSCPCLRRA